MTLVKFKTQQECFIHVSNGKSIFLDDGRDRTEIKFIDGVLKAFLRGEWVTCPVNFENARFFHA